jgi:hypothetical protein
VIGADFKTRQTGDHPLSIVVLIRSLPSIFKLDQCWISQKLKSAINEETPMPALANQENTLIVSIKKQLS